MRRKCWHFKNNRRNLWSEVGWLRRNFYLPWQRSTQSAWKQCGARHARLNRVKCTVARPKEVPLGEGGSHKARQNGPKHYPRGFKGPPTGAPPKPNEVGLVGRGGAAERLSFCPERQNEGCGACDDEARLSPLSFFKQRKMVPPEVVPKRECWKKRKTQDSAPGGRQLPNAARKNEKEISL